MPEIDLELQNWLELKSSLHQAMLDRLNLSVIDKMDAVEFKRQVAGLVAQLLSEQGRTLGTRKPLVLLDGPNQRWSLDFVSDAFTDGRRFRILTVVDDYTRENLALVADTSLSGLRVTRELDRDAAEMLPSFIILAKASICEGISMADLRPFLLGKAAMRIEQVESGPR